jgi:hypothetical protein
MNKRQATSADMPSLLSRIAGGSATGLAFQYTVPMLDGEAEDSRRTGTVSTQGGSVSPVGEEPVPVVLC